MSVLLSPELRYEINDIFIRPGPASRQVQMLTKQTTTSLWCVEAVAQGNSTWQKYANIAAPLYSRICIVMIWLCDYLGR